MAGNVQFILGRAGTGKSRVIQERIVALLRADPLGPPVYLLVPAQATFVHERFYALAAGVEGYARLRVVSFENLGEDVIAECGGEAMVQVSAAGRQMLLGHLLRTHADQLGYFKPVARQLGLVAELDRTFAELERAGYGGNLGEALPFRDPKEVPPEYAALQAKLNDLALMGRSYRKALGEDRLDATRRLEHVLKNLEQCQGLSRAHLFVDGFFRFSAFERKMLARLASVVSEMRIALTLDPRQIEQTIHETDLFHPTVTTYRQLLAELEQAKVAVSPPLELETLRRFKSRALELIERDWSMPRHSAGVRVDASGVTLTEAPDLRAEADAAARQVKQWLAEGLRLRDIAVLCRDLSTMQPLLEASFQEHDLPFFTDRRRPAAHHPLVRFVRSALRIATRRWPHESVMELCKCGLAGMALADADALENFTLEHRIRGRAAWTSEAAWSYSALEPGDDDDAPDARGKEESALMDALRRDLAVGIVPLAAVFDGDPRPVRDHLAALWACLEHFDVRRRLEEMIDEATAAGRLEEAAEHAQAWDELMGLLGQAVELLGEEHLGGEEFVATLEYGLDLLDLAIVPPAADEVVIGDVERSRVLGCRAAVIMGMNEGTFPRSHTDATVLADEERRLLRRNNVDVDPEGRSRQLAERFLAYRALTTPSERLALTRSASGGEGRPATASPYWGHVQSLLGLEPRKLRRESAEEPSCIGTPRQLAGVLMHWARDGGAPSGSAAALYQFLAEHDGLEGPLGLVRRLAWRALSYENRAALKPETARRLFKEELSTSVSRLEKFARCPFSHYASHVLKLRAREDTDEVSARDMGTMYHGVLERLVRHCISQELAFVDAGSITPEKIQEMTLEIGAKLRGQIMLSNARNQYLLKRIQTVLQGVVASQQAVLRRGKLTPLRTELRFGEGEGAGLPPLALKTPAGRSVRIYGQIDRVDYHQPSGYAAVIDYKHGGSELKLDEVSYGLSLQLLVYLLVLQRNGASLADPPPQPAAALYVKLLRGITSAKHPGEGSSPGEPAFDLRAKPRGVIDADALPLIDADYCADLDRKGFSDAYSVAMSPDGTLHRNLGNDLVASGDLDALIAEVEKQVVRLADEVMAGVIDVRPYKLGTTTPCPWCEFRPVCRFDHSQGNYLDLQPRKKWDVLDELRRRSAPDRGEEE